MSRESIGLPCHVRVALLISIISRSQSNVSRGTSSYHVRVTLLAHHITLEQRQQRNIIILRESIGLPYHVRQFMQRFQTVSRYRNFISTAIIVIKCCLVLLIGRLTHFPSPNLTLLVLSPRPRGRFLSVRRRSLLKNACIFNFIY